jgi:hypothetical protein
MWLFDAETHPRDWNKQPGEVGFKSTFGDIARAATTVANALKASSSKWLVYTKEFMARFYDTSRAILTVQPETDRQLHPVDWSCSASGDCVQLGAGMATSCTIQLCGAVVQYLYQQCADAAACSEWNMVCRMRV